MKLADSAKGPGAPDYRLLAIAGSLRRDSFNRKLVEAAARAAPARLDVEVYDGLPSLPMFNEDIELAAFENGPVRELAQRVANADALLIATPEYNHSFPGVLKNAIDWLSRPLAGGALTGKPVGVIGATTGRWGTRLAQAALRQTLFAADALVVAGPAIYLADARNAFDANGRLIDEKVTAALRQSTQALTAAVRSGRCARQPDLIHAA